MYMKKDYKRINHEKKVIKRELLATKKVFVDVENGKKAFFACYGNRFHIYREFPEYNNYNIPETLEVIWKDEIISDLYLKIETATGLSLSDYVIRLSGINHPTKQVELLENLLDNKDMDTFTKILLLESYASLKIQINNYVKYKLFKIDNVSELLKQIQDNILKYKKHILNTPMTIDKSYRETYFLKTYNFSQENLIVRVGKIQ